MWSSDVLTSAALVGLGAAREHAQPTAADGGDVPKGKAGELTAAQGGAETDQQERPIGGAEWDGRGGVPSRPERRR